MGHPTGLVESGGEVAQFSDAFVWDSMVFLEVTKAPHWFFDPSVVKTRRCCPL